VSVRFRLGSADQRGLCPDHGAPIVKQDRPYIGRKPGIVPRKGRKGFSDSEANGPLRPDADAFLGKIAEETQFDLQARCSRTSLDSDFLE